MLMIFKGVKYLHIYTSLSTVNKDLQFKKPGEEKPVQTIEEK